LKQKKPEVVNYCDENFMRSLELAVRFGKTLIVQEVDKIDPIFFPIIRRTLQKHGPRYVIELGDKLIDYNDEFHLLLVSKLSDFKLPSNVVGFINDINFTITRAGLSGQLLGVTIKQERPQLEIQKSELLKNEENMKIQLAALEEQLLKELANAEGNILENKSLIQSLNEAKEKSLIVHNSLQESKLLQESLDFERLKYMQVANHGSSMYFVVNGLSQLNSMYKFSLSIFLKLFQCALSTQTAESSQEERNKILCSSLEKIIYNYISRSLFKADRITFAMFMIKNLHPELFGPNDWALFTGFPFASDGNDTSFIPDWMPSDRREMLKRMKNATPDLLTALNLNEKDVWLNWMMNESPELYMPRDRITAFQKILIIQSLRPDKLLSAMNIFVLQSLGLETISVSNSSIEELCKESTCQEPIWLITTPGVDPSQELREFARLKIGTEKFHEVSMGQGQGELAINFIRDASRSGEWVCLQNVHLVIGWVNQLEKELISLNPHPEFRLWLTSETHLKFPQTLLEKSLKVTFEAPPGLKKNLQRIYDTWGPEMISNGSVLRAQSLFALAWFHAVIQERRTYIPQGWNKFYEFSAADLRSSVEILNVFRFLIRKCLQKVNRKSNGKLSKDY
jgi:dynein heavy chain 2